MINQYNYTIEDAKEVVTKWWTDKFKKDIKKMIAFAIIGLVAYFLTSDVLALVLSAVCVLLVVLFFPKTKNAVDIEIQRMEVANGKDGLEITVRFGDEIVVNSKNGTKTLAYEFIEKIIESENFIILCVKGEMTLALKKDSFVEGSKEECIKLLKEKMNYKIN